MKDGSTRSFKQAQRARSIKTKKDSSQTKVKQQKKNDKKSKTEIFSPERMEVLGAMANSPQPSMYDIMAEAPPGPHSFKRKHIMERLGDLSLGAKPLTVVQSALAKLNITLEDDPQ